MTDYIRELIHPELLSIVPALYLCGIWMKQSSHIKDELIPMLLGAGGLVLATIYTMSITEISSYKDVLGAFFASTTQGLLCAGASVYWHQLVHQREKSAHKNDLRDINEKKS